MFLITTPRVTGRKVHQSLKDLIGIYLKSAEWNHTRTYAKINNPISMDITSNYKIAPGIVLDDIKEIDNQHLRDCKAILEWNALTKGRNGVYSIYPDNATSIKVYCDMTTEGGGWTVIQRRFNGQTNFRRKWNDYKNGFGKPNKEYWLGNDVIHTLTSRRNQELRIDLGKFTGSKVYAKYTNFSVASGAKKYQLSISGYTGNAGDMMIRAYNLNGMYFTTIDRDNDQNGRNCAVNHHTGGWWYGNCAHSDLNGVYATSNKRNDKFLFWGTNDENMKTTKMMIRSKN
ncbi:ryncolin-2-like [Saccostrea cucullata]|uniref:ryncolin-2-like n=1 Tax=Saccostrea cuccullata TaxID=36930 RepID=UPI002ED471B6